MAYQGNTLRAALSAGRWGSLGLLDRGTFTQMGQGRDHGSWRIAAGRRVATRPSTGTLSKAAEGRGEERKGGEDVRTWIELLEEVHPTQMHAGKSQKLWGV